MRHKMCVYVHVCRHLLFGDGFIFPALFPFIYLLLLRFFSYQVGYKLHQRPGPRKNNIALRPTCREEDKIPRTTKTTFLREYYVWPSAAELGARGCYFPANSLRRSRSTTLHSFSDLVLFPVLLFCFIL